MNRAQLHPGCCLKNDSFEVLSLQWRKAVKTSDRAKVVGVAALSALAGFFTAPMRLCGFNGFQRTVSYFYPPVGQRVSVASFSIRQEDELLPKATPSAPSAGKSVSEAGSLTEPRSKSDEFMRTLLAPNVSLNTLKERLRAYGKNHEDKGNCYLASENTEDAKILDCFNESALSKYSVRYEDRRFYLREKQAIKHPGQNKSGINKGRMIMDADGRFMSKNVIMALLPSNEQSKNEEGFLREVQSSDRFPKLIQVIHSPADKKTAVEQTEFILKLYKKGNLSNCSGSSIKKKMQYACDVLRALVFLHEHGICHGDINPGNIFISGKNRAVLGDFGCAYRLSNPDQALRHQGMPRWSPSQAQFRDIEVKSGEELFNDIWSAGLVFYEMFICKNSRYVHQCRTMTLPDGTQTYGNGVLPKQLEESFMEEPLKFLIGRMLLHSPQDRPTAREALDIFLRVAEDKKINIVA